MFRSLNEQIKRRQGRMLSTGESLFRYVGVCGLTVVFLGGLYLAIMLLE